VHLLGKELNLISRSACFSKGLGHGFEHRSHLAPRLIKSRALPLLIFCVSMACYGSTLTFIICIFH